MTVTDVDSVPRQVVCVVPIAAAAEQVLTAWICALQQDPLAEPAFNRVNCGLVEQRQCMRVIIGHALDGKPITQELANHINRTTGTAFLPTTLHALTQAIKVVLREDMQVRPVSVAVVEAAYSLNS
jgi:hypothetical protein